MPRGRLLAAPFFAFGAFMFVYALLTQHEDPLDVPLAGRRKEGEGRPRPGLGQLQRLRGRCTLQRATG